MMEVLLELLKEEREKRQAAECEVQTLRMILQPLQEKEMARIQRRKCDVEDKKQNIQQIPIDQSLGESHDYPVERELGSCIQHKFHGRGRIVCDCFCDDPGYDEVD